VFQRSILPPSSGEVAVTGENGIDIGLDWRGVASATSQ
jgi:hypothetical protein